MDIAVFEGTTVGELAEWLSQFPAETRIGLEQADIYWAPAKATGPWRVGAWEQDDPDGPWTFWNDAESYEEHRRDSGAPAAQSFESLPSAVMFTR